MIEFARKLFHPKLVITPWDDEAVGFEMIAMTGGAVGSAVHAGTNLANYYPINVLEPFTVTEAAWLNGTVVSGTNSVDVGIYDSTTSFTPGARIVSVGSGTGITQAGTSAVQTSALTDTVISPGLKWLAFWCSNTTSTFFRAQPGTINLCKAHGWCSETIATGLPATATPVSVITNVVPVFGFTLSPRTLV